MAYSEWQLGQLRKRLATYQVNANRTWENVAIDIISCEGLPENFRKSADFTGAADLKSLSEALRRFANLKQILKEARLDALKTFLTAKKLLGPKDLDEEAIPLHAAYAFAETYGRKSNDENVRENSNIIFGTYQGFENHGHSINELILDFDVQSDGDILTVLGRKCRGDSAGRCRRKRAKLSVASTRQGHQAEYLC